MEKVDRERVLAEYRTYCSKKDPSYYNYENLSFEFSSCEPYEIKQSIGRGKYSDVFEGVDSRNGKRVVIKILKPVRKVKIAREIRILELLKNGPNIVGCYDICFDSQTMTPSIIFEFFSTVNLKNVMLNLSLADVKVYMFQVFRALDYCHSQGIMHRDVKPMNIIIDAETKGLKLIDWGLSEFYIEKKEYNTRVSSRPYKSPELLLNYLLYDFSLDIWSAGTMFAAMLFRKEHFFLGKDNQDQLAKIVAVLGTKGFLEYVKKYNMTVEPQELVLYKNKEKREFSSFVNEKCQELCTKDALNLLERMLIYDHNERITAREALAHPFFADLGAPYK